MDIQERKKRAKMKSFRELQETKGAPQGYHFTRDGKLKKGDAGADGPGGKKLRSDPLDKQRSKIPPLPEENYASDKSPKRVTSVDVDQAKRDLKHAQVVKKRQAVQSEGIERRADAKVVKTHTPDGKVVFRKQKPEIKVEKMDHAAMARDALRKGDMKAYKRHQNSAQAEKARLGEAAPKPLNRSDHTHTVHIDGEGQYKVKAKSMDHAKKLAFKKAGISKLHGHPTMEPKTRILGELSPATHSSYQKKAQTDIQRKWGQRDAGKGTSDSAYANQVKRKKGIAMSKAKSSIAKIKTEATVNTADIQKKKMISKSDTAKLGKVADMLAREREKAAKQKKPVAEHAFAFGRKAFFEGRRPKDAEEEGPEHIIMQLRKSVNMNGQKDVTFKDGKTIKVDKRLAQRVLDKYNRMKPLERLAFQKQVAKSHNHLQQAIK
jgi:hypothetical protein